MTTEPQKQDRFEARAVPNSVLTSIRNAPLVADIFPVDQSVVQFTEQVLKVNTVVFRPGCKLLLTRNELPWLAVVARTIKFAAPDEVAEIAVEPNNFGIPPVEHRLLPSLPKGKKGGKAEVGGPGDHGQDGLDGVRGADGPDSPTLYLMADSIQTQSGAEAPTFITLTVRNRGRYGNEGGRGQDGQGGGEGGDGGDGVWNESRLQCTTAARSGGPGGNAGAGGNGGDGGKGGDGGDVHFAGSAAAIDLLEYAIVKNLPGPSGLGNLPGDNGAPGKGGDRGAHPGACTGGSKGPDGAPAARTPRQGARGPDGQRGAIQSQVLSVAGLF